MTGKHGQRPSLWFSQEAVSEAGLISRFGSAGLGNFRGLWDTGAAPSCLYLVPGD